MKKILILFLSMIPVSMQAQTTIKYVWATEAEIYSTDLYSGGDADIAGTQVFSDNVDLATNGYVKAAIQIEYDASGTTDGLILQCFGRFDNTWDGDEVAVWSVTMSNNAGADTWRIFDIPIFPHVRFGFVRTGSTDTFDADVNVRLATVQAQ